METVSVCEVVEAEVVCVSVVFGLLVLVLIFKPRGLLGEETTERA